MKDLREKNEHIVDAVSRGEYRYTLHAAQQRIVRGVNRSEIEDVLMSGEIIEDYPSHQYGPACLVFGKTKQKRILHIVCSLGDIINVITVYEPNLLEWEDDFKKRRR